VDWLSLIEDNEWAPSLHPPKVARIVVCSPDDNEPLFFLRCRLPGKKSSDDSLNRTLLLGATCVGRYIVGRYTSNLDIGDFPGLCQPSRSTRAHRTACQLPSSSNDRVVTTPPPWRPGSSSSSMLGCGGCGTRGNRGSKCNNPTYGVCVLYRLLLSGPHAAHPACYALGTPCRSNRSSERLPAYL